MIANISQRMGHYSFSQNATGYAGKNLSWHDFSGRNLENVDFSGADLTSADLSDANLLGANFTNANLKNVKWTEKTEIKLSSLRNAKNVPDGLRKCMAAKVLAKNFAAFVWNVRHEGFQNGIKGEGYHVTKAGRIITVTPILNEGKAVKARISGKYNQGIPRVEGLSGGFKTLVGKSKHTVELSLKNPLSLEEIKRNNEIYNRLIEYKPYIIPAYFLTNKPSAYSRNAGEELLGLLNKHISLSEYAQSKGNGGPLKLQSFAKLCEMIDRAHENNIRFVDIKLDNLALNDQGEVTLFDVDKTYIPGINKCYACTEPFMIEDIADKPEDEYLKQCDLNAMLLCMLLTTTSISHHDSDFVDYKYAQNLITNDNRLAVYRWIEDNIRANYRSEVRNFFESGGRCSLSAKLCEMIKFPPADSTVSQRPQSPSQRLLDLDQRQNLARITEAQYIAGKLVSGGGKRNLPLHVRKEPMGYLTYLERLSRLDSATFIDCLHQSQLHMAAAHHLGVEANGYILRALQQAVEHEQVPIPIILDLVKDYVPIMHHKDTEKLLVTISNKTNHHKDVEKLRELACSYIDTLVSERKPSGVNSDFFLESSKEIIRLKEAGVVLGYLPCDTLYKAAKNLKQHDDGLKPLAMGQSLDKLVALIADGNSEDAIEIVDKILKKVNIIKKDRMTFASQSAFVQLQIQRYQSESVKPPHMKQIEKWRKEHSKKMEIEINKLGHVPMPSDPAPQPYEVAFSGATATQPKSSRINDVKLTEQELEAFEALNRAVRQSPVNVFTSILRLEEENRLSKNLLSALGAEHVSHLTATLGIMALDIGQGPAPHTTAWRRCLGQVADALRRTIRSMKENQTQAMLKLCLAEVEKRFRQDKGGAGRAIPAFMMHS